MCYTIGMVLDRRKIGIVGEVILTTIGVAGVLTVAMAIPGAAKLLGGVVAKHRQRDYYYKNKLSSLIKNGLIKKTTVGGKVNLQLTPKGNLVLNSMMVSKPTIPRRWDGRWRIVMFDIWERSRTKRDKFRRELKTFGFIQLQQSVWVYPYDCQEYIMLLRTNLRFGKNIRYIVADYIDGEKHLLQKFDLSKSGSK